MDPYHVSEIHREDRAVARTIAIDRSIAENALPVIRGVVHPFAEELAGEIRDELDRTEQAKPQDARLNHATLRRVLRLARSCAEDKADSIAELVPGSTDLARAYTAARDYAELAEDWRAIEAAYAALAGV
ncbi:hypothetical protein [Brevibacterium album]|uniref:hypothetical protein n=1 Tax=Brevibacterium album TaxID=417948 RepID=UPI00048D2A00|nr:hypothetical protein [Brevibacterium album]